MTDQEAYDRAEERVNAKIGFRIHLAAYVVINILLLIINISTLPAERTGLLGDLWFLIPLLGWGIGIACHAVAVFAFTHNTSMIQKEMAREREAMTRSSKA